MRMSKIPVCIKKKFQNSRVTRKQKCHPPVSSGRNICVYKCTAFLGFFNLSKMRFVQLTVKIEENKLDLSCHGKFYFALSKINDKIPSDSTGIYYNKDWTGIQKCKHACQKLLMCLKSTWRNSGKSKESYIVQQHQS